MKTSKRFVKRETPPEVKADSAAQQDNPLGYTKTGDHILVGRPRPIRAPLNPVKLAPMDTTLLGSGIPNYVLDRNLDTRDFGPLATDEELAVINQVYEANPVLGGYVPVVDNAWINTFTGKKLFPLNPREEDICIEDIAHALSNICRFTGHVLNFYSVAQHSVLVSYLCNAENALWGLLHDSQEFACQDISSPLKKTPEFASYRVMEANFQKVICQKFGLSEQEPPDVKKADLLLLAM